MSALHVDLSSSLALESIGKQALGILRDGLNDEIVAVQTEWDALDAGFGYLPVEVERIRDGLFYHGHRPSLIDAPVEMYPNCSVMAYSVTPGATDFDHEDRFTVGLFVELMCKSDEDEAEVNSRIQRTTDAAHRVIMKNTSLGGLVDEVANSPRVEISDVFTRMEQTRTGRRFLWQGSRIDYQVFKYASRSFS